MKFSENLKSVKEFIDQIKQRPLGNLLKSEYL